MAKRVCVIGAGPAGLASLRYLTEHPGEFDVIAFEQTAEVGGTWAYTQNDGADKYGRTVHSSMYPDLITNLPKETMAFPGFPFPDQLPSYVHNIHVKQYYEDFSQKLSLRKYIQFETKVVEVRPIEKGIHGGHKWEVKVQSMIPETHINDKLKTYYFDAVIVCNGHYWAPNWVALPGLDLFKGELLHSRSYRRPEDYAGKTVAVLSAGLSSMEIAHTLTSYAKHVYQCRNTARSNASSEISADNLTTCTGITEVKARSVVLEDGKELEIDTLILCTGYLYSFPFLTLECRPKIKDNRVSPLYKHVIHAEHPTLGFVGMTTLPILFDMQARFFIATLTGQIILSPREDMVRNAEEDYQKFLLQGISASQFHRMLPPQFGPHCQDLVSAGGIAPLPPVYKKVIEHALEHRKRDFVKYKEINYTMIDDENFEAVGCEATCYK